MLPGSVHPYVYVDRHILKYIIIIIISLFLQTTIFCFVNFNEI